MSRVDSGSDAWRLKLKRAQAHISEIERELQHYADSHPYEAVKVEQSERKQHVWVYRLHMTAEPDPCLAVMVGEFMFNLRSALDNVVAASVPRKYRYTSSFPINLEDPFYVVADHGLALRNDKVGKAFGEAVRGLPPGAVSFIDKVQPYRTSSRTASLGVLARLNNADKHRELITFATGVRSLSARLVVRNIERHNGPIAAGRRGVWNGDSTIVRFESRGPELLKESDVELEIRGAPLVQVRVGPAPGYREPGVFPLRRTLWRTIKDTRFIVDQMERYVLR